jgi:hypothetical protein
VIVHALSALPVLHIMAQFLLRTVVHDEARPLDSLAVLGEIAAPNEPTPQRGVQQALQGQSRVG